MIRIWPVAVALLLCAVSSAAQEDITEVAQEAAAAYADARYEETAQLYAKFLRVLPRSISARTNMARALARAGKPTEALAELAAVVAFGVRFDPADAAWDTIRSDARFKQLESQMRARTAPIVRGGKAFLLARDLIPENIAYDSRTGAFFAGSMYKAKIVKIAADGAVSDFVPSRRDGLRSVVGMKVDVARRELFAVSGNFGDRPPMEVLDPQSEGKSALFRFNVDTGALIRSYPAPEKTLFNDLVIGRNGDVYVTAGDQGIWRLKNDVLEQFVAAPRSFFNGIAITPDGKTLFAASHFEGVMKIDVATKSQSLLDLPPGLTLGGIDGLYFHQGSLIGIQNGTDPMRVVRAWLNPAFSRVTRYEVLEQDHPQWDIPLTGTIVDDHLYYVGRSQLRAFDGTKIWPAEKLQETVILKLPLKRRGADVDALLALHEEGLEAHRQSDVERLLAAEKGGTDFVVANRGEIRHPTLEEQRKSFGPYLQRTRFTVYRDQVPPIVKVSADGTLGWVIAQVEAKGQQTTSSGATQPLEFVSAWIELYEKRDGRWVSIGNVSNFKP